MREAFAADLVPVKGQSLERGDTVYEIVRFGSKPGDQKFNRLRVVDTNRGAAVVEPFEGTAGEKKRERRTIPFANLKMERPAPEKLAKRAFSSIMPNTAPDDSQPTTSGKASPAPLSTSTDEQFEAFAEMGRELLTGIIADIGAMTEQLAKITGDLETVDARHRRTIEELEQELLDARRAHEEDRALAAARREAMSAKVGRAQERLNGIRSMLGEGSNHG